MFGEVLLIYCQTDDNLWEYIQPKPTIRGGTIFSGYRYLNAKACMNIVVSQYLINSIVTFSLRVLSRGCGTRLFSPNKMSLQLFCVRHRMGDNYKIIGTKLPPVVKVRK